jgi:hypothetical protein
VTVELQGASALGISTVQRRFSEQKFHHYVYQKNNPDCDYKIGD